MVVVVVVRVVVVVVVVFVVAAAVAVAAVVASLQNGSRVTLQQVQALAALRKEWAAPIARRRSISADRWTKDSGPRVRMFYAKT